jgi:hypothetical protein
MFDQQNNSGQRDKKCLQLHTAATSTTYTPFPTPLITHPHIEQVLLITALRLTSETHANHGMGAPKTIKTGEKMFRRQAAYSSPPVMSSSRLCSSACTLRFPSRLSLASLADTRTPSTRKVTVASSPSTGVCFQRRNSATMDAGPWQVCRLHIRRFGYWCLRPISRDSCAWPFPGSLPPSNTSIGLVPRFAHHDAWLRTSRTVGVTLELGT